MRKVGGVSTVAIVIAIFCLSAPLSHADVSPSPTPSASITRTPIEQFRYERGLYQDAMKARDLAIRQINIAFKGAIEKSTQDYKSAMALAKTPDQKFAATTNRKNAVAVAIATRDSAINALGAEPTPPVEPVKSPKVKAPQPPEKTKNR